METIKVERGATILLDINLGFNVSGCSFNARMREGPTVGTPSVASWLVSPLTDGKDGNLLATIADTVTENITHDTAWLFVYVFDGVDNFMILEEPLEVEIIDLVTP